MTVTKGKRRLNLLVIDDDELDRLAVRRCVQQSSLDSQADPVGSAAEAFQRDLARYDCILLDYYLPGEDGLETLQRIRETAPHVPVVIFTGHGDEDIAVELMKAGAADYLPKASLTPERLEAAIRHALHVTGTAEARERAEGRLRLLSEAAQHLLTANEPDELLQGLWQRLQEPLGVDAWFNVAQDRRGRAPRVTASGGLSAEVVASLDKAAAAAGTPAPLAHDETVQIDHLEFSDEPWLRTLQEDGIRACVCHPLYAGGVRLGTLCFATRRKDEFAPDEVDFLRTVSHYATIAYERLKHIEAMRESERRKDEFLATLAHELRDPLAPLANVVELMKLAANGDAVLERARRTMDRQLRQLVRLVDDLLDVARITGGQLKLRKRHVKLAAPLRHAIETIQPLVDAAGQALEVELPDEDIWVNGDRARLTQVFGNLLTNASKFSEP
ncbi:MAG TPA: response regulator, partial [Woeseiaceae bacterium]